jgi:transcriptional regulator with XRE-family HTH domain
MHKPREDVTPTTDRPPAGPDVDLAKREIGVRVRALRLERHLTVRDLAEGANVTPAMISQIERGTVAPSLATLLGIAATLRVHVADLFGIEAPSGRVVRRGERRAVDYPNFDVRDEWLSADATGKLLVLHVRIGPRTDSGPELVKHGAETEFVLVISGKVEIIIGGERVWLEEGDAVTFSGEVVHGWANPTDTVAELLWVMTPANY